MTRAICALAPLALALSLTVTLPRAAPAQAMVTGQVLHRANGAPVAGLTVSLVHPVLGRSYPSITNQFGWYALYNIPYRADYPYYIEVYWGLTLLYRAQLVVTPQTAPSARLLYPQIMVG